MQFTGPLPQRRYESIRYTTVLTKNPRNRFSDAVHAIVYSIMLLNTDLHIAEISSRMSRTQFVKNTLSVVLRQSDAESPVSMPAAAASTTSLDDDNDGTLETTTPGSSNSPASKPATLRHHPKKRSGSLTSWRSIMQHAGASQSAIQLGASGESPAASRVSLNLPTADGGYFESPERRSSRDAIRSSRKLWEQEVENLLKVRPSSRFHLQPSSFA
jgi:PH/SEC7 domain-containing protein